MSYPPLLEDKDLMVLEIIARGNPARSMTSTRKGLSKQVSALTWNEIQVALNAKLNDIADSIARLGSNKLIESGEQYPSIWEWVTGKSLTTYIWITPVGENHLNKFRTSDTVTEAEPDNGSLSSTPTDLQKVGTFLKEFGFEISNYGSAVALLSLESGYSHCETASCLAVATLALDISEAGKGLTQLMAFMPHGRAMLHILAKFRNAGLIREEIFKSDGGAILGVVTVSKSQLNWISRVLSNPVIANRRVAVSLIKRPS